MERREEEEEERRTREGSEDETWIMRSGIRPHESSHHETKVILRVPLLGNPMSSLLFFFSHFSFPFVRIPTWTSRRHCLSRHPTHLDYVKYKKKEVIFCMSICLNFHIWFFWWVKKRRWLAKSLYFIRGLFMGYMGSHIRVVFLEREDIGNKSLLLT